MVLIEGTQEYNVDEFKSFIADLVLLYREHLLLMEWEQKELSFACWY